MMRQTLKTVLVTLATLLIISFIFDKQFSVQEYLMVGVASAISSILSRIM